MADNRLVRSPIAITPYDIMLRFVGEIFERQGEEDHPFIVFCHGLTTLGEQPDEVPWCSSMLQFPFWLLRLARSKSAAARSWLEVGAVTTLGQAQVGFDVVILRRGSSPTAGHCGLFAGKTDTHVHLLGANQSDTVSVAPFDIDRVLGVRRIS